MIVFDLAPRPISSDIAGLSYLASARCCTRCRTYTYYRHGLLPRGFGTAATDEVVPELKFETYQDVRRNLVAITTAALTTGAAVAVLFVFSDAHRQLALDAYDRLQGIERGVPAIVVVIAGVIAWALVDLLRVVDNYDRFVVRWRASFDADVIVARLYMPFAERVDRRFMDLAPEHRREFMNALFYEFVRDRDAVVKRNLVVRFWERSMRYWLGQMFEILLLVSIALVIAYRMLAQLTERDADRLFGTVCVVGALLVLNRLFIRTARAQVRAATLEEIDDIVTNHCAQLLQQVRKIADRYQVPHSLPAQA